ncbi:GNAT family N-acetyltransferase [Piscinibacter sakaiensis]|uniref:Putative auxin-binding protein n=1 Tax=Piscinibacter sakaiensis TaxID=1547922 RepID=A0A0K8NZZ5_PISS1|nr:GNAT family N-acetyltransferase [Piscinibacter sakaiensis]GAP35500.1 putative auxin-binding protein [Piscinibacter sakaiensis]
MTPALPDRGSTVVLREIDASTVRTITDELQLAPHQVDYVASNAVSLAQALFHPEAWYRAIVADGVPVGFVMLADETLLTPEARRAAWDAAGEPMPEQPRLSLWRFMIDHRVQGRGFGRAALACVAAHARTRPGITVLQASCVPGPASPQPFYEALGFVPTGVIEDGEVGLVLDLDRRDGPLAAPADAAATTTVAPATAAAAAAPPAGEAKPQPAAIPAPGPRAAELAQRLLRHVDEVALHREQRAPLYDTLCARLGDGSAARKLGASVDTLAPGMRGCPYHLHHAQEELFVVLDGEGHLRVAGEMLPVRAGHVVFMPAGPDYPHQFVNTSARPLRYVSIGTRETPEICEYPDSGKDQVWSVSDPARGPDYLARQRRGPPLDYWDGEP